MTKIAINGFGRIGRLFLRQAFENPQLEIVAINDLGNLENLAYLFKYDSIYRTFQEEVKIDKEQNFLIVGKKKIKFFSEKDPINLPWKKLEIDIVVEATGVFEFFEKAKIHIDAGAKKVILTAPAKDDEGVAGGKTILVEINDKDFENVKISSNASCTTNAVYPIIEIMKESVGVQKAILNTIHALTNSQSIVDSFVKGDDFRRGRAGSQNIIPSTTGAAVAVTRVIKDLKGKFDGIALRVPVITGSIADITFLSDKKTSVEEINEIFKKAARSDKWKNIIKIVDEQIVSSDIIGEPYAAIIDLKFTKVIDGDLVKILSWYDNEWGYVAMLIKHLLKAAKSV
ncbi:type I glyceraldehyde-3-phosphate dehydrogenase [Candidatus Wolfebacteria bacterium]|nr:type I glyceraldehyde-3-phosphate dehydrogenase [Candidatus Wolfebacteria bacterium]